MAVNKIIKSSVEKKVAAKKVVSKTVKTLSKDKTAKTKVSKISKSKKVVAKKTVAKLAPKKNSVVKGVKKVPAQKSVSKKTKKEAPTDTKPLARKKTPKKTSEVSLRDKSVVKQVVLPTNMSQRSVEKSMVLSNEFFNNFQNSAFKIAYISGLCFVLVGLSYSASSFVADHSTLKLSAEVVESTSLSSTNPLLLPSIELTTNELPSEIVNTYPVSFRVVHADNIRVQLVKKDTNKIKDLLFDKKSDDSYRFVIAANQLDSGYYYIKISAIPIGANTPIQKVTNIFQINHTPPVENNDTQSTSTIESIKAPVVETKDTQLKDTTESIKPPVDYSDDKEESVEVSDIVSVGSEKTEAVVENKQPENNTRYKFSISSPAGQKLSGSAVINLLASTNSSPVYLYRRSEKTQSIDDKVYVAQAFGQAEARKFVFNTDTIPDGKYQFFAETKLPDGKYTRTESISITIYNKVEQVITAERDKIESFPVGDIVTIKKQREFVDVRDSSTEIERSTSFSDSITSEVRSLINNDGDIDRLMRQYAVAIQSGDEALIQVAKKALQEERMRLVTITLENPDVRNFSDKIDEQLQDRIVNLQKRVETFEQLRKDRSGGETAIDTDEDGVSDFDEVNLYGTDPKNADTDNDGFTDGVEIVRGFSPLSSESEVVIKYESPKESVGLVQAEVLTVEKVSAVVKFSLEEGSVPVTAEIRGKSLPNSFVTLYIFSSPTIVTIKTNDDGSFIYNFDKELEDGQHEVYAAITDNAGEIIAQSNPFSFIKEAQAFTPVDASESETYANQSVGSPAVSSYSTVAGMGILALGLILIMLGITLRPRKKEDEDIYEDTILPAESPTLSPRIEHINAS